MTHAVYVRELVSSVSRSSGDRTCVESVPCILEFLPPLCEGIRNGRLVQETIHTRPAEFLLRVASDNRDQAEIRVSFSSRRRRGRAQTGRKGLARLNSFLRLCWMSSPGSPEPDLTLSPMCCKSSAARWASRTHCSLEPLIFCNTQHQWELVFGLEKQRCRTSSVFARPSTALTMAPRKGTAVIASDVVSRTSSAVMTIASVSPEEGLEGKRSFMIWRVVFVGG